VDPLTAHLGPNGPHNQWNNLQNFLGARIERNGQFSSPF
jgi:hypothetical protein